MATFWGIDLGGTKIEGVVLDSQCPTEPIARHRVPTEQEGGYDHILSQIEKLVCELETTVGPRPNRIGIGTPGAMDPASGLLKNSNTTCLNGKPLSHDLSWRLEVELKIANDANCFALAEASFGAAKGEGVVFGVIMGTGVGGGIVVDGKVLNGAQGIAGEWGHNILDPGGFPCYCGKRGCVETVLSGPALERYYMDLTGESLNLAEIAASNSAGAQQTIDHLCESFGRALSVVVNILDPDAIVIGGGVGNVATLYDRGRAELHKNVFNNELRTKLLRPILGDSAGVFGAALLMAPN